MASSPRRGRLEEGDQPRTRPRRARGVEGRAELGEAAGLGDADAEHLLRAGGEEEGGEARPPCGGAPPRPARRRLLRPMTSPVRPHWVCITAAKSCRLSGEIAVERRLGGAGGAGDLVDAGAFVAAIHEDLARPLQHLGGFRAALHAASASLTAVSSTPARFRPGPIWKQYRSVQDSATFGTANEKTRGRQRRPLALEVEPQLVLSFCDLMNATSERLSWPHSSPLMSWASSSWVQTGALTALA